MKTMICININDFPSKYNNILKNCVNNVNNTMDNIADLFFLRMGFWQIFYKTVLKKITEFSVMNISEGNINFLQDK